MSTLSLSIWNTDNLVFFFFFFGFSIVADHIVWFLNPKILCIFSFVFRCSSKVFDEMLEPNIPSPKVNKKGLGLDCFLLAFLIFGLLEDEGVCLNLAKTL